MTTAGSFHEEERLGTVHDRALVGWLLRYARPHGRALAGCVLLLLVLTALQLAQPYVIKLAIDRVMRPAQLADSAAARAALVDDLWGLVAAYAALVAAFSVLQYAQALWLRVTGQHILAAIRADTFRHMQDLGLAYFDSRPTGRIVTRVTNDIEALGEMYTSVLVNLFRDVFFIVGAMAAIVWLDPRLAVAALALLPFVVVTAMVFRRYAREAYRTMRLRLARINANLSESLSGMRLIQVFGREDRTAAEFAETNEAYYASSVRLIRVFGTFGPTLSFLTSLSLAGVIWLGGRQVLAGALTFGTLYAFTAYLRQLYEPISALAEKFNILQAALAASERIAELQMTEPAIRDPAHGGPTLPALRKGTGAAALEFDRVWFAYRDGDWVLRDVSFRVEAGETVAFVGHTGAGKSTIMNLVPRFYDVQRGSVRVHGLDVREVPQRDLRTTVGIVMQDVFLFASDVASNIALDRAAVDRSAVARAARIVGADAFIDRLEHGLDTPVVERGLNLSTGQRQLISFARTLAHDPAVLILDEATSSVDSETEEALQKATRAIAAGRTTIIVAHRLATVRDADRIYVMHRGRIVEQGRHADLLSKGGMYRTLWRLQFEGEAPAD